MAVIVNAQINGQVVSATPSYCYLYEPLRVSVSEDDLAAAKIYIDLEVQDTSDSSTIIETLIRYGDYDVNPGLPLFIDLMKLAQQHHDANVYNYSNINEIVEDNVGWYSAVSRYRYNFKIYSNINTTPISVIKIPIIGGRDFSAFIPNVENTQVLTEADLYGVDLSDRWLDYPYLTNTLSTTPEATDAKPSIEAITSTKGKIPCGGYLVWKSRYGGWMTWGFDIKMERNRSNYVGQIEVGMFESTQDVGGNAYVPADYTRVELSYTKTLKALSLTEDELKVVDGINSSPAVYYMKDSLGSLELMRLTSATVPRNNLSAGGDFSVNLKSISKSFQKTR